MNSTRTILIVAAAAAALSTAACGSSAAKASASKPVAVSYSDAASLLAAMAARGATCSGATFNSGGVVPGEVNPYVECTGISSGDTSVLMFTDHASALAYGNNILNVNLSIGGPAAEVVGPNWTVNTVPAFARKVVSAVGGQLISASTAPAAATPSPSAPAEQTDPNGQQCASLDSLGYCPGDDPSPSSAGPTMTKQTDIVVFSVSGSGEPTVQYGTNSSTNNPSEGAGPLGDGVYLPWQASMTYDSGALYYAVTAQLQGGGSIRDSVTEVITTWCSGSSPKTESFPLANGSASGGYGIATAEYTGGDTGNAQQAESDAGC
jgi:hypothetical protein